MHFDGTITAGNLLTMAALIGTLVFYFIRIDAKVGSHDKWIEDHAKCNKMQIEILAELRNDISYLRGMADGKAIREQRDSAGPHLKDRY